MFSLVAASMLALAQQPVSEWTDLPTGRWEAWLDSPGGKLECEMNLRRENGATIVEFVNDTEHVVVPIVNWNLEKLTLDLEFPHYDSRIACSASTNGSHLEGVWTKRVAEQRSTRLAFHADYGFEDLDLRTREQEVTRWKATFDSTAECAVVLLRDPIGVSTWHATGYRMRATVLTTLGDYRYLSGRYTAPGCLLTLSCFDGAHAFLFKAQLKSDGSLAGDFWSGDSWHETWTAVRDDNAKLPDPFELTKWNESAKLDAISFPDLNSKQHALTEYGGKARMLVAFGSWCPNCNDEAEFLRELDAKYRERGLSIVGLAFELTGDFARDAKQVGLYAERHKLTFPTLIAGTSDKAAASKSFPLLDKIRAFPTTIFLHGDGRVRAVHQGYSGPATGAEHTKLREDFERLINELLAESDAKR